MARNRLRSRLGNNAKTKALLNKIAALHAERPDHLVVQSPDWKYRGSQLYGVVIDETQATDTIRFQRPPTTDGAEQTTITTIADTGAKAVATLDLTADITLTATLATASRNTNTFTLQVLAAAANPTDTILVAVTGTAAAIVVTVTPNDGTNNSATPVNLTTANLVELINTGAVTGKTVTLSGANLSNLLTQTATGGGATNLADGGEGDGVVATFSGGANSNLNNKYFTLHSAENETDYYAWFDVNSQGVDPAVADHTGIAVTIAAGATAAQVATALAAALDANADFEAAAISTTVTVTNADPGPAADMADGAAATGFTFSKVTELESYDIADIKMIKRLRTKKWAIVFKDGSNPAL